MPLALAAFRISLGERRVDALIVQSQPAESHRCSRRRCDKTLRALVAPLAAKLKQNQKAEDMLRTLGRVVRRAAAAPRSAGGGCARRALATHVLNVPAMGDSITEGTVASVEKAVGDAVAVDEIVAVIDTDKVSVDVRSDTAGVVQSLSVAVDDEVQVGAEMMTLDTDGAAGAEARPRAAHQIPRQAVAAQEGGFCACTRARRRGAGRGGGPVGPRRRAVGPRAALRPDAYHRRRDGGRGVGRRERGRRVVSTAASCG